MSPTSRRPPIPLPLAGLLCLAVAAPACRERSTARGAEASASTTADATPLPAPPDTDSSAEAPAAAEGSPATMEEHLGRLAERVPEGFTVVPEPPFVVIGDGPPERVRRHAEIVGWTVRLTRQDFFEELPRRPVDVWVFEGEASYREWAWKLFGDRPRTPYGYFSPAENALVLNIATGGGTLVHEIVHPLLHADFPKVPPWFNECLAALFEQSAEEDGHIVGRVNWRLPGLQEAIRDGRTRSLAELLELTSADFYERSRGLETAQSRYICYYLQQHDLLLRFHATFRRDRERDPTGRATLLAVTGFADLGAFEEEWQAFVLELRPE